MPLIVSIQNPNSPSMTPPIDKSFTDLLDPSTSIEIVLMSLPAGYQLSQVTQRPLIQFAGTGITGLVCEVGISGDPGKFVNGPFDILQAPGPMVDQIDTGVYLENWDVATNIIAKITSTGANLDQLTAGEIQFVLETARVA